MLWFSLSEQRKRDRNSVDLACFLCGFASVSCSGHS